MSASFMDGAKRTGFLIKKKPHRHYAARLLFLYESETDYQPRVR
jgi:hypothetical protein